MLVKSDFNIWSNYLSLEQLLKESQTCGSHEIKPDILDWSNVTANMIIIENKNALIDETMNNDLCRLSSSGELAMIVPNDVNPKKAQFLCEGLNANMFVPKTKTRFQTYSLKCLIFT